MEQTRIRPAFSLLNDEEALNWLVSEGKMLPLQASRLIAGCRAVARSGKCPDEGPRHLVVLAGESETLLSLAARPYLLPGEEKPGNGQIDEIRGIGGFPDDIPLTVAPLEYVEYFARAFAASGIEHPLDRCTVCVSTRCAAGHQLIVEWKNGTIVVDHKNFLAYGYGAVPRFAAYLIIATVRAS